MKRGANLGVECYDFETEMWSPLADMPTERMEYTIAISVLIKSFPIIFCIYYSRHGLAYLNGRIYIMGGYKRWVENNTALREHLQTVDIYDPDCNQWSPAPDMTMETDISTFGVAVLNNNIYAVRLTRRYRSGKLI